MMVDAWQDLVTLPLGHCPTKDVFTMVAEKTCLYAIPDSRVYQIVGDKAQAFLQGQLTQDMALLEPSQWLLGAHCNIKGRVLAIYQVWQQQDLFLQLPGTIATTAIPTLSKYATFSRVTIEPIPQQVSFVLWGPEAAEMLEAEIGKPPTLPMNLTCYRKGNIFLLPGTKPAYQVTTDFEQAKTLWQHYQTHGQLVDDNAWQLWNILQSFPQLTETTIGQFTPHELNLPHFNGVSFSKGCYTGQEIIARMEFRGKLKSHLYQADIKADELLLPGHELLYNDRNVGLVVNAAWQQAGRQRLLILLKDDMLQNQIQPRGLTSTLTISQ